MALNADLLATSCDDNVYNDSIQCIILLYARSFTNLMLKLM